ncbi:hypothetical protein Tco_1403259 [Tanacetum coccineum]
MKAVVQQYFVDKQCFEIHKKELFLENDRLLQKIMSQDVMICVMTSTAVFDDVHLEMQSSESCVKCFNLDAELLNKQNAYNDLSKSYSQLEKHCISLELTIQLNQEIFQKDSLSNNQNALEILEYFENNDLKAQLQAKDTTICKLKEHIKSMRETDKEKKVKHEMDEMETINIELEHSVAKLLSENERLHKEIEHLKKIYKDQFDSIKKTRALSKEHGDSLIAQLNSKSMENADLKHQLQDKEPSDVGSLRVVVYGYDRLPMHPPSPDYVSGPKHPLSPLYVPYVPEPAYPEFMPPEDDVLLAEEQPLPAAVSPSADSPDDEVEEESSGDDANDEEEDKDKDEDKEEEEHPAPVDSIPPPAYRTTARMSIRDQTPIPYPSEAEVDRLLAISTPPPSTLTSYSSPLPQIPSPPLLVSPPLPISSPPLPASPTNPLGYKAAMIRLRAESPSISHPLSLPPLIVLPHTRASMAMMRAAVPSTYILAPQSETPPLGILPIPLPTSSSPLLLPSTDCRADVPEVTLPPRKRLCIAPGPRFEVEECSSAPNARPARGFGADYGFIGTLDAEIRRDPNREIGYGITDVWMDPDEIAGEIPSTDMAELGQRKTNFVTTVRQDTDEIYGRLNDAQDNRSLMSDQLNLLRRDKRAHACTDRFMESEARTSREAWVQSMDASDMARFEVSALWTTTQMAALQSQQTPARDSAHPDVPEEAGSSS